MPADSQPDQPRTGRVLVVGGAPDRREPAVEAVGKLGLSPVEFDDPYAAMAELCRRPVGTAAILLSLHGLYREELQLIAAVKRAHPAAEVWLTDIDARPATLAEAMRLGADGLLGEDGLRRVGGATFGPAAPAPSAAAPVNGSAAPHEAGSSYDLVLAPRVERVSIPSASAAKSVNSANPFAANPFADDPLSEDGGPAARRQQPDAEDDDDFYAPSSGEPILTADELRALLQDYPDASPVPRDEG